MIGKSLETIRTVIGSRYFPARFAHFLVPKIPPIPVAGRYVVLVFPMSNIKGLKPSDEEFNITEIDALFFLPGIRKAVMVFSTCLLSIVVMSTTLNNDYPVILNTINKSVFFVDTPAEIPFKISF